MEYKGLHDDESAKVGSAETRKAILEKSIIGQRKTLEALLKAHDRNPDAFGGKVGERIERKKEEIRASEEAISALSSSIERRRGLVSAIAQFNPCRRQADRKVVKEQFIFAKGSRWLEWNASKRHETGNGTNSRFKTFQDIITPPEYRILPKREGIYGEIDFDELPLDPVIVDPARISDVFLQEFESAEHGIAPVPEKSHELDRLREKARMIPNVKRFFQNHVRPVTKGSFDGSRLNYRVLAVEGYDPRHDGKLIMPHYDTSDKPDERSKVMAIYGSAYSARRMTMKLYPGYAKESKLLHQARELVGSVSQSLAKVRTTDTDYDKKIEDAQKDLRKIIDMLGGFEGDRRQPRTHHKMSAHKRLLSASEITDTLGRVNKGATAAKLVAVCSDLLERIEEVDHTSIAGPVDQNTLSAIINQSEITLSNYGVTLESYIAGGKAQLFNHLKGTLQALKVRPFNLYAAKLVDGLKGINRKIGRQDKNIEAKKALGVVHLFSAHRLTEDFIGLWDANPNEAVKQFQTFFSNICLCCSAESMSQLTKVIETLRAIQDIISNGVPENPEEVREALKDINFEELLEHI